jgi:hypothetical protein
LLIKELVHRNLAGYGKHRGNFPLHASDLTSTSREFCPREVALAHKHNVQYADSFVGTALQITFQYGRFIETLLRNQWLKKEAYGYWACSACDKNLYQGFCKFVTKCTYCHSRNMTEVYKEVSFRLDSYNLTGSVDLFVLNPNKTSELLMIEIKTIDKDQFLDLKSPKTEHSDRTNMYLRMIKESEREQRLDTQLTINTDYAHIVYFSKAYGIKDLQVSKYDFKDAAFSPIKEFVVRRDDFATNKYLRKAFAISLYMQDNTNIPARICDNSTCTRAKNCPVMKQCFKE